MLPEHYIQWIELLTPTDVLRHELKPGEKPEAIFLTNAEAKVAKLFQALRIEVNHEMDALKEMLRSPAKQTERA